MASSSVLFKGRFAYICVLEDVKKVADACPKEFFSDNPWSKYISELFYHKTGSMKNWKPKEPEKINFQL